MKTALIAFIFTISFSSVYSQLSVTKLIGKNASQYKMGYDVFSSYEFPLNSEGYSKAVKLELVDLAIYPSKNDDGNIFTSKETIGYLSVKLGYKVIFSETKTGFYIEPSAGFAQVLSKGTKNGIAAAVEGGYSLEVGQNGHSFTFGLKFETDRAGPDYILNSLGFRVSFLFGMFRKGKE